MLSIFSRPTFLPSRRIRIPTQSANSCGLVVLSYLTESLREKLGSAGPRGHTNWQECRAMTAAWGEAGYDVDVISAGDQRYTPPKDAFALIDIHSNLERWQNHSAPVKVLHATGAHWLTQNRAELERLESLRDRRGVSLVPRRFAPPSRGAETADVISYLGNDFTAESFQFAQKPMQRIPLSSAYEFPFPGDKDWEAARRKFLWLGSYGMVHKGLDLVLEAFAANPDLHLTICGRPEKEADFFQTYRRELTLLPNIHLAGWTDPASAAFDTLRRTHGFVVYPSCSEGGGGSLIHCMHAGLVPIATREASVDLREAGLLISECSVTEVVRSIQEAASMPANAIKERAEETWNQVRANHTLANFKIRYSEFVEGIIHGR